MLKFDLLDLPRIKLHMKTSKIIYAKKILYTIYCVLFMLSAIFGSHPLKNTFPHWMILSTDMFSCLLDTVFTEIMWFLFRKIYILHLSNTTNCTVKYSETINQSIDFGDQQWQNGWRKCKNFIHNANKYTTTAWRS